jgi:hypothetical protein
MRHWHLLTSHSSVCTSHATAEGPWPRVLALKGQLRCTPQWLQRCTSRSATFFSLDRPTAHRAPPALHTPPSSYIHGPHASLFASNSNCINCTWYQGGPVTGHRPAAVTHCNDVSSFCFTLHHAAPKAAYKSTIRGGGGANKKTTAGQTVWATKQGHTMCNTLYVALCLFFEYSSPNTKPASNASFCDGQSKYLSKQ